MFSSLLITDLSQDSSLEPVSLPSSSIRRSRSLPTLNGPYIAAEISANEMRDKFKSDDFFMIGDDNTVSIFPFPFRRTFIVFLVHHTCLLFTVFFFNISIIVFSFQHGSFINFKLENDKQYKVFMRVFAKPPEKRSQVQ